MGVAIRPPGHGSHRNVGGLMLNADRIKIFQPQRRPSFPSCWPLLIFFFFVLSVCTFPSSSSLLPILHRPPSACPRLLALRWPLDHYQCSVNWNWRRLENLYFWKVLLELRLGQRIVVNFRTERTVSMYNNTSLKEWKNARTRVDQKSTAILPRF